MKKKKKNQKKKKKKANSQNNDTEFDDEFEFVEMVSGKETSETFL